MTYPYRGEQGDGAGPPIAPRRQALLVWVGAAGVITGAAVAILSVHGEYYDSAHVLVPLGILVLVAVVVLGLASMLARQVRSSAERKASERALLAQDAPRGEAPPAPDRPSHQSAPLPPELAEATWEADPPPEPVLWPGAPVPGEAEVGPEPEPEADAAGPPTAPEHGVDPDQQVIDLAWQHLGGEAQTVADAVETGDLVVLRDAVQAMEDLTRQVRAMVPASESREAQALRATMSRITVWLNGLPGLGIQDRRGRAWLVGEAIRTRGEDL